jgi:TolB-like protein/tetratricopeptide (TPR) repeat protein
VAEPGRLCPSCQTPIPGDARTCPSCGAISLPGVHVPVSDAMLGRLREALGRRYRIEREIGQGGMAVVYLAHDLRHDRAVALKVLRPELSAYVGAERFLREIHIAAQLSHPHVLALYDSGDADGLLYFVMPYVEGESLRQKIGRLGPLPLAEAVAIAGEVADALAYAHELGVVHRDIKPENILLSHGHAAIADFGIARAIAGAGRGPAAAITTTGISPGTPLYMSPEQAAGEHALDQRADIYSLGCVLFEMLTGRPPFAGATPQALLVQHATGTVPSARAARPEVPEALDAAVRKALAKAPADRFRTAAEFRAAFGGTSAAAAPSPAAPQLGAAVRWRNRAIATGAVLVATAGVMLLLREGQAPPPPAPQPRAPLSVVVQPFEDLTGHLRTAAAELTERLTHRLQQVPALTVPAYTVVAGLPNASLDTLQARFKPDRVVVGRLAEAHGRLEARLQIVDAATSTALSDTTVAAPRGGVAADSLADRLGVFVRHAFWNELDREARRARVRNPEAWSLVTRARELRNDASLAIQYYADGQGFRSLDAADSLLREAYERDQASDLIPVEQAAIAERRAFYVEAFGQMLRHMPAHLPAPAEERRRALAELNPLIEREHGPADALELRGRVEEGLWRELHADSLLDAAIADYRAATELETHRASAWRSLASAYLSAGLFTDALWAIQHAFDEDVFELDRKALLRAQFDVALRAGEYDLAAQACRAGAADWPTSELFNDCDLQLWAHTRDDRRSAADARAKADSLAPHELLPIMRPLRELWVADILARAGLGDSADHVAQRATRDVPAAWQPLLLAEEAYLRLQRGDPDSALALIGAVVRIDPTIRNVLRAVPWFAPLHADPRFERTVSGAP